MKLHEDKEVFGVLLNDVSLKTGVRYDILEKDYYLTLLLHELSIKQDKLPAYFKGGTALYKALKSIKRFSEDIDLTVEASDCSRSQGKKRLEEAANSYKTLNRTREKEREINAKGSITSVYEYTPIIEIGIDRDDILQRFGYVKVEATSFTISEPYEPLEVEPLIYTKATPEQKKILEQVYELEPFMIKTIKIERIFADKILAAEFYYQRNALFDVSKHLYDIAWLLRQERIQELLRKQEALIEMLSYKRMEEKARIGSDLADKPFDEFILFQKIKTDKRLEQHFMDMQKIYVFDESDILMFTELLKEIGRLEQVLLALDEGLVVEVEH